MSEYNCLNCKARCVNAGKTKTPDREKCFVGYMPKNHGDKLRSMNNEQLARYLWIETNRMTVEEWLDWLNREAK